MPDKNGADPNFCTQCGTKERGNVRSFEKAELICAVCVMGMALYVENHPEKYAHLIPKPESKIRKRINRLKKKRESKTIADC